MSDEVTAAVRSAIERERERRDVTTDAELAKSLGIFPKHISRWKHGKFTRLDRILAELIIRNQSAS